MTATRNSTLYPRSLPLPLHAPSRTNHPPHPTPPPFRQLSGPIPTGLAQLPELAQLHLGGHRLTVQEKALFEAAMLQHSPHCHLSF
jgi:hypothetical protein